MSDAILYNGKYNVLSASLNKIFPSFRHYRMFRKPRMIHFYSSDVYIIVTEAVASDILSEGWCI